MTSLLTIIPRTSGAANYQAVVNGDVFRADDGSFGSVTSRPGETVITGTIKQGERGHRFLVRHEAPLQVQTSGPITKEVREDVQALDPTRSSPPGDLPGGPPTGAQSPGPPDFVKELVPSFGIPGEASVPNDRVRRGAPFEDKLLSDKSAVKNSRVGGMLMWTANQAPEKEIPVKAVLSANNPDRPLEEIRQVAGQAGTSGLRSGLGQVEQTSSTTVEFTLTGAQAERLQQIEGASFFVVGADQISGGVTVGDGSGSTTNGGATTGSGDQTSEQPPSQDRIISGIPDALLGAGIFAGGALILAMSSGGSSSSGG